MQPSGSRRTIVPTGVMGRFAWIEAADESCLGLSLYSTRGLATVVYIPGCGLQMIMTMGVSH